MKKKENVILILIVFLGTMAGALGLNIFNRYVLVHLPLVARMVCMILTYWLIALVPIIIMICTKTKLSSLGFSKEKVTNQLIMGVVIAIAMSIVLTLIPHLIGLGEWVDNGRRYTQIWKFIYEFVYCIFAVAAVEELIFRGFLYAKLKETFGCEWVAILISSVMFGLVHIWVGNIVQVFATMVMGIFWCLLRLKIKNCSLLTLIVTHGIYDALIAVWASVLLK